MTPEDFIHKWRNTTLTGRSGAQSFFNDICALIGHPTPPEADPKGEWYAFEYSTIKTNGGKGWADVFKRDCFAWENKGPEKDLGAALLQLRNYAGALHNPPVLVVCNRERIELHPCFTGYPDIPQIILLEEIGKPENIQALRWLFSPTDVIKLRPLKSNAAITQEAATEFAALAERMRIKGSTPEKIAHFLIQCVFCMYAEDEGIIHSGETENQHIFTALLKSTRHEPKRAVERITTLFQAMQTRDGKYGNDDINWFNGGLFKIIDIPPLDLEDLIILHKSAEKFDWRAIDPTIFGTLFERGLDPQARAPLGAHYTDIATIKKLIDPLITHPLTTEWEKVKEIMRAAHNKSPRTDISKNALTAYQGYLLRLREFRVLDPACGSGNFLYLALRVLKDLEHHAQIEAETLGFARQNLIETGPINILGIEKNEYAAELARATVWIGDLQWSRENGREIAHNPILRGLDGIQCRDALINPDGSEAEWPEVDVIVGNPPFIGDKKMRSKLGDKYTVAIRKCYAGRIPGGADFVTYWLEKARLQIHRGKAHQAGFVTTNSIRGGANRKVLENIVQTTHIFNAWSDEPWINEGAAVRVSLVCFGNTKITPRLNGQAVLKIHTDLTAQSLENNSSCDLTTAQILKTNLGIAFIGTIKNGAFDISGELARQWLKLPNPHNKPNSNVLRPWANGMDITRRPSDTWIIDFGINMNENDAALYEKPFQYLEEQVKKTIENKIAEGKTNDKGTPYLERQYKSWWLLLNPCPGMRDAMKNLTRYICTPRVAKYRIFVWRPISVLPDSRLCAVARDDDATFGILHSRLHEIWSLATCSWHGVGNDPTYNAKSCFETFPFPEGFLDASYPDKEFPEIANQARQLNELRENWLNPAEWTKRELEIVSGYPDRIIAKAGHERELKKRTLTNLYNQMPAWLKTAHQNLDQAVARAYGWKDYSAAVTDKEVLRRLLALNQEWGKIENSEN